MKRFSNQFAFIRVHSRQKPSDSQPSTLHRRFHGLRCAAVAARCSLRSHPRSGHPCPALGRNPYAGPIMSGDVHDRRILSFILPTNDNAELTLPTVHPNANAIREVRAGFAANNMHSSGGDFRAAIKLEHARGVPPRIEWECLGDDECAAAKTEKQTHRKGSHGCRQT